MDCLHLDSNNYEGINDKDYTVFTSGIMRYLASGGDIITNPLQIVQMLEDGILDFNELYGFYKVIVYNKKTGVVRFWSDNSGSQRFYIDVENGVFSDSLMQCAKLSHNKGRELSIDIKAVTQYFTIGYCIDDTTLINSLEKTSVYDYYELENGTIKRFSKNLYPMAEGTKKITLNELMRILCHNIDNNQISDVITGGTDSRVILSHLIKMGYKPNLIITGNDDAKDVLVAQQVSDALDLHLYRYKPIDKEEDWLKKAFDFSDGIFDVVMSYRHLRKLQMSKEAALGSLEFGGVGGELFKNYFFSSVTRVSASLARKIVKRNWYGSAVNEKIPVLLGIIKEIENNERKRFHCGFISKYFDIRYYNSIGYIQMVATKSTVSSLFSNSITKIDPLMDYSLVNSISQMNPFVNDMQCWHRREINKTCPQIAEIKTDRGYTLSNSIFKIVADAIKQIKFTLKSIIRNITKRKIGLWDLDYKDAKENPMFEKAVNYCKNNDFISKEISLKEIPVTSVGNVLLVGMMLEKIDKINQT